MFQCLPKRQHMPPWELIVPAGVVGYLLCWATQVPHPSSEHHSIEVAQVRRIMPESHGFIPQPFELPQSSCGTRGACFTGQDWNRMYLANLSHTDQFDHVFKWRAASGWAPYPSFEELHHIMYHDDPSIYEGFIMPAGITDGVGDSHINSHSVELLAKLLGRPVRLMLEVGSGTGNSAAIWGKELLLNKGVLVAIDHWAGDMAMWLSEAWREVMGWQAGHAHLWERFMQRIILEGLTTTVVPLRATPPIAARFMRLLNCTVDAIYLDMAQDGGDMYLDLAYYWDVLAPGGVLMGDDYMWYWPGVVHDVDLFAEHIGIGKGSLHFSQDWDFWKGTGVWALQKPLDATAFIASHIKP